MIYVSKSAFGGVTEIGSSAALEVIERQASENLSVALGGAVPWAYVRMDAPVPVFRDQIVPNHQSLIEKIKLLPPDRLDEVEDFVDFVASRAQERSLARVAAATSEAVFAKIWTNLDDDAYDAL